MAEANEHIRKLNEARTIAVKARREVVDSLTGPYKRGDTENMRNLFVKLQNTIEAIDCAISDERGSSSDGPPDTP